MKDDKLRQAARALWAEHRHALELAMRYRPRIGDICEAFERNLTAHLGDDFEIEYYPQRGDIREFKVSLPSWSARGFPFCFMFYASADEPPRVRVFLWGGQFEGLQDHLEAWAQKANADDDPFIDETFAPIRGWTCWRRVLKEADDPTTAVLANQLFDDATAREAAARVATLAERLRPHIETA